MKNTYKAEPCPHLGYSDPISVMLIPANRCNKSMKLLCKLRGIIGLQIKYCTTYPTIVEMQSAVSAADQDRIIGAPAGGRRAIASKAVSTGVKSISCVPSSLILSSNSGSRTKECCLKKGEISISAWYSSSVRWYNANSSIWRIEPLGTVIHKVWLGKLMRVAVSCWSYFRVAVHAGVLTSHRFPMISACVTSTWECGVASAGQLVFRPHKRVPLL